MLFSWWQVINAFTDAFRGRADRKINDEWKSTRILEKGCCKAGGTWRPLGLLRVLCAGQSPGSPHLQQCGCAQGDTDQAEG